MSGRCPSSASGCHREPKLSTAREKRSLFCFTVLHNKRPGRCYAEFPGFELVVIRPSKQNSIVFRIPYVVEYDKVMLNLAYSIRRQAKLREVLRISWHHGPHEAAGG